MDRLIAGAVDLIGARVAYANANGLSPRVGATYRSSRAPWRKVWHTMEAPEDDPGTRVDEGWELDQIRSYIVRHRTPPHLWALPKHDVVFQTVPLTFSAYALRHNSGDPETNHVHAIQTEVIGYAKDGLDDPDLCDWLGRRVLAPIIAAGVPINLGIAAPSTGSDGYGTGGRVRMTWQQWANFNGQCGHANVPGNSHWDPGRADYLRIARAAGTPAPTPPAPVPLEDDDMPIIISADGAPAALLSGNELVPFAKPETLSALAKAGVKRAHVHIDDYRRFNRGFAQAATAAAERLAKITDEGFAEANLRLERIQTDVGDILDDTAG